MLLLTITFTVLSVLYALAWHNQPAREPFRVQHLNREQEPRE